MRLTVLLLAFLVPELVCSASYKRYPVSDIPPELLAKADFIVRLEETRFEVKSMNHAVCTEHLVITILKEGASEHAMLKQYYDNYTTIKSIEGSMYDSEGILLKEFKSDDIIDHSAVENGSLYSDDRVKIIRPLSATYPFTVEYLVEYSCKRILNYPEWIPRDEYRESVQSAKLIIKAADGLFPRIKTRHLPENVIIQGDGVNEQTWEVMDLKALDYEPLSPGIKSVSPVILAAPTVYNVKGYTGDFSTWKGVGLWMGSLYEGRDTLNVRFTEKIQDEVDAELDTIMKVKKIYQFMQKTCRYVSTDVGIGGWQPERANDVARLGYGDCKGLVNYTKALCKKFGIKSICALVSAGTNMDGIIIDFPCNQFNHVILAVPLRKDTVWLECTDPMQPFGFLGSFTGNREALLLTAEGGVLARTQSFPKEVNTLHTRIGITVDSLGNAEVERTSLYRGLQFEDVDDLLALNPEHLREKAKEIFDIPGLTLKSIQMTSAGDNIPEARETLKVTIKNYASLSGGRMFIPLNRFLDEPLMLKKDPLRQSELVLRIPYIDYDTLILHLPVGFSVESLPQSCYLKTQFGQMVSEVKADGTTLKLCRKLEMGKGIYPIASFNDFAGFVQQISRQDKTKVVLKR